MGTESVYASLLRGKDSADAQQVPWTKLRQHGVLSSLCFCSIGAAELEEDLTVLYILQFPNTATSRLFPEWALCFLGGNHSLVSHSFNLREMDQLSLKSATSTPRTITRCLKTTLYKLYKVNLCCGWFSVLVSSIFLSWIIQLPNISRIRRF